MSQKRNAKTGKRSRTKVAGRTENKPRDVVGNGRGKASVFSALEQIQGNDAVAIVTAETLVKFDERITYVTRCTNDLMKKAVDYSADVAALCLEVLGLRNELKSHDQNLKRFAAWVHSKVGEKSGILSE